MRHGLSRILFLALVGSAWMLGACSGEDGDDAGSSSGATSSSGGSSSSSGSSSGTSSSSSSSSGDAASANVAFAGACEAPGAQSNCAEGLTCRDYPNKGKSLCTHPCSGDADCEAPSGKCGGQGFCAFPN